jgi:hypothetical protein
MADSLRVLRAQIKREARYIGRKPYSHNIVRLVLADIDKRFGRAAANKAVRDFNLEAKGFNEEPNEDS